MIPPFWNPVMQFPVLDVFKTILNSDSVYSSLLIQCVSLKQDISDHGSVGPLHLEELDDK